MSIAKLAVASVFALAVGAFTLPHTVSAASDSAAMKMLDPDADGTVSLDEAKAAAVKKFESMDPDKDGKVDMKEATGPLKDAFKAADPDNDGTVDKAEYMAVVTAAFKKADPDGDGTLDAKEMETPAGKNLLGMLQ